MIPIYNKSEIMSRAWKLYKAQEVRTMEMFGTCLSQSWNIAKNRLKINIINNIHKKYYDEVFYSILSKLNNKFIAEELTNTVFEKASRNLHKYKETKGKLNTWLLTIAKNVVIDYYRANKNDSQYINVSDFSDAESGKEVYQFSNENDIDILENMELQDKINVAINGLGEKYKTIAKLFFVEQKKYAEISEQLNIPLGSVKGMINRCRTKLQVELKPHRA